jgi:hypothetical protein
MAATTILRSTDLTLPLTHDCSVDQMLEGREGMVH